MRWREEFRPKSVDQIIGQEEVVKFLLGLEEIPPEDLPHLIFVGPKGVGKTSAALVFRKDLWLYLVNASLDKGIEAARELIKHLKERGNIYLYAEINEEVIDKKTGTRIENYRGTKYLLNEAGDLTQQAQDALKDPLEQIGSKSPHKVILTANSIKKLDPILTQDRFTILNFKLLSEEDLKKVAEKAMKAKNFYPTEEQVEKIIKQAKGDARNVLDDLQNLHDSNVLIERYDPEEEPPNGVGESWAKYKVIDKKLREEDNKLIPVKWAAWSKVTGLPVTISIQRGNKVIISPIPLKKYPDNFFHHLKRYRRKETGEEFYKVGEKTFSQRDFKSQYSEGRWNDLLYALESLDIEDEPDAEYDLRAMFEYWVIEASKKAHYSKDLAGEILVEPLIKEFKITTKVFKMFCREYELSKSLRGFALEYGYEHGSNTIFGEDHYCIYGKFSRMNPHVSENPGNT